MHIAVIQVSLIFYQAPNHNINNAIMQMNVKVVTINTVHPKLFSGAFCIGYLF